ncbi:PREDICTED: 28S ribosomal protein S35, mitochondrial [Propithecus coquereli]|uniref:28S ribosomal protein S35, mitochondrial n=1 Tax=Propithecus coquereli TaxID=379532 RepID=UPI00063F12B9|nr:PREDICTED: 28S ribosomal protein S35, mitochondrial [Propithecus coquereli]
MAAAALTAWLGLQPGARTLRAFSTSVSPATRSLQRTSRTERLSKRKALPPRTEKMAVDQDWPSVYPAAAPFKPSAVPLPVRMGYPVKKGVPMAKEGNLELLKVKLSSLNLDDHAKKKLIKLIGERYCKTTDVLTIKTDRKTEEWEKNKTEADMEEYVWKNSSSEKNILETLLQIKAAEKKTDVNKEELLGTKEVEDYRNCVVTLKNEGENENTLSQYKESVKRLLNLT